MDLDKTRVVAVLGDIDSAKTSLAIYTLRNYKGNKKIYMLGYPKPIDDFVNLSNFNELFNLTDSIIFIDEIQRYIKTYDHHKNTALQELMSFFAHNNNTLIMTLPLSQFITKGSEGFIDTWLITNITDLPSLKNGSRPKRIIQMTTNPKCTSWSLSLNKGEYLEYSPYNALGENGIKTFPDQGIKKDWKISQIFAQNNVAATPQTTPKNSPIQNNPQKLTKEEIIEKFQKLCNRWTEQQIDEGNLVLEKCEKCGRIPGEAFKENGNIINTELIAHHNRYSYPFSLDDISIICKSCHGKKIDVHEKMKLFRIQKSNEDEDNGIHMVTNDHFTNKNKQDLEEIEENDTEIEI